MKLNKRTGYSKYYRKYKRYQTNTLRLYPPYWQTSVFYSTYSANQLTTINTIPSTFFFFPTTYVETMANFVAMRAYFGEYRVEKMTMTLSPGASGIIQTADVHDMQSTAAILANIGAINKYASVKIYNDEAQPIQCVWRMQSDKVEEVKFKVIPTNVIPAVTNTVGGICYTYQGSTVATQTGLIFLKYNIKYKIRFSGKNAIEWA